MALCHLIGEYALSLIMGGTTSPLSPWNDPEAKMPVILRLFESDELKPCLQMEFVPETDILDIIPNKVIVGDSSSKMMGMRSFDQLPTKSLTDAACHTTHFYSDYIDKLIMIRSSLEVTLIDPQTDAMNVRKLVGIDTGPKISYRCASLGASGRFFATTSFKRSTDKSTEWSKNSGHLYIFDLKDWKDRNDREELHCVYGPYIIEGPNQIRHVEIMSSVVKENKIKMIQLAMISENVTYHVTLAILDNRSASVTNVGRYRISRTTTGNLVTPRFDYFDYHHFQQPLLFDSEWAVISLVPFEGDTPTGPPIFIPHSEVAKIAPTKYSFDRVAVDEAWDNKIDELIRKYKRKLKRVNLLGIDMFVHMDKEGNYHLYRFDLDTVRPLAQFIKPISNSCYFFPPPMFIEK